MATVAITITGKQSSRLKILYDPAPRKAEKATMTTRWSKSDWEGMLTDEGLATATASTLGVTVEDLRAGITTMQEQVRQSGPAVYRAFCGKEVYDRTDGTAKKKAIPEVWMGHAGDERHEQPSMRVDKEVPEGCQGCPKLKIHMFNFRVRDDYEGPGKDAFIFPQAAYVCKTFALVPGADPPPPKEFPTDASPG